MSELAPGFYRLKVAVKNPERVDRRTKDSWQLRETCPAGAEFRLVNRVFDRHGGNVPYQELVPVRSPNGASYDRASVPSTGDWFKALAPNLEPVEMNLGLTLKEADVDAERGSELLACLIESGKLQLSDITDACKAWEKYDEKPYYDFLKKHGLQ